MVYNDPLCASVSPDVKARVAGALHDETLWPLKDGLADQKDDSLLKNQGDIWEEWDDRKAVTCKTG